MEKTHTDLLKGLVGAGIKWRYSTGLDKWAKLRILWEMGYIINEGYVDYYLMAFWIFRQLAKDINYWARGAVPSSIVCYCLGITEIDPVKYGLHSERFVNDEPPKFQFDIEASRIDEFKKGADEFLQANAGDYDIEAIKTCLLREDVEMGKGMRKTYLTPCESLSRKYERPLPENIDDEIASYALNFPDTKDFFDSYVRRKEGSEVWKKTGITKLDEILSPTYGILAYQEQMLDILREIFHTRAVEANHIRLAIQRGETEQVDAYKAELFANLKDLTTEEAERVWSVLVSNPRAFIKAASVSQIVEKYKFKMEKPV